MKKNKFIPQKFELKVKRSKAGLGLYTMEPIRKGACIIEYTGRTISHKEEYTINSKYLFEVSKTKTIDGSSRKNVARYINHSCAPNCEIDIYKGRVYVSAVKNIKAGQELAYDYDAEYFDEYIKPHGCRCNKCAPHLHKAAAVK